MVLIKQGITVIMATHNLELSKRISRRIVKIEGGKIIYDTKRVIMEINIKDKCIV